jgi:hypothetical protein
LQLGSALQRVVGAQQGLLHDILGLGHAAQHPIGDRKRRRTQLGQHLFVIAAHHRGREVDRGHA